MTDTLAAALRWLVKGTTKPPGDCRSATGNTIGLIDGIIAMAHILVHRDLSDQAIVDALTDLREDEDVLALLNIK